MTTRTRWTVCYCPRRHLVGVRVRVRVRVAFRVRVRVRVLLPAAAPPTESLR